MQVPQPHTLLTCVQLQLGGKVVKAPHLLEAAPAARKQGVKLAAHAQPSGACTAMARERFALWQGVLQSLAATPAPTR